VWLWRGWNHSIEESVPWSWHRAAGGAWPFPTPDLEGILEYHCHDGKTRCDLRVIHITGL